MRIKIGDKIYLNSDSQSYWITQERITQKGKNAGKVRKERATGYYRNIKDVIADIPERKIRECDAKDLDELKTLVSRVESLVREIIEKLSKFDKAEIRDEDFSM